MLQKQYDNVLYEGWARDNQFRLGQFREPLRDLLDHPVSAKVTDILGAVQRASLFLVEPITEWRKPPLQFALFVTDGLDDVHAPYMPLPVGTRLILVNGSASLGALASLRPVRVESFEAAVRYIAMVAKGEGK
jgi:hypothetical protein